jgi:hypothetical protein
MSATVRMLMLLDSLTSGVATVADSRYPAPDHRGQGMGKPRYRGGWNACLGRCFRHLENYAQFDTGNPADASLPVAGRLDRLPSACGMGATGCYGDSVATGRLSASF